MSSQLVLLNDIAEIIVGIPTKPSGAGGQPNVLSVRALTGHGIDVSELETARLGRRDVERYRAKAGDVVLSSRSTSVRTAVVPDKLAGLIISSSLICVRLTADLHPRLLMAWFCSDEGMEILESHHSGSSIKSITAGSLKQIEVPVPPRAQQQKLVALLEAADEVYSSGIQAVENRLRVAREAVIQNMKGQKRG